MHYALWLLHRRSRRISSKLDTLTPASTMSVAPTVHRQAADALCIAASARARRAIAIDGLGSDLALACALSSLQLDLPIGCRA
jgi:uncharacterized metal-binding protein